MSSTTPTQLDVVDSIKQEYSSRWGITLTNVRLQTSHTSRGSFWIASYVSDEGARFDDVVYVAPDGRPKVFENTEDLIKYLELRFRRLWIENLFDTKLFAGVMFIILLSMVFWVGMHPENSFDPRVLAILGSVVGLAAALFFGANRDR